jgi:hypothetical protein
MENNSLQDSRQICLSNAPKMDIGKEVDTAISDLQSSLEDFKTYWAQALESQRCLSS